MQKKEEIRNRILNAAEKRFTDYGFNKTTMMEIARDCKMSAANLYRFFPGKQDIGVGVILRFHEHTKEVEKQIFFDQKKTGVERLQLFVREFLRFNYFMFSNKFHIFELIKFISTERQELVKKHWEIKLAMVEQILVESVAKKEFQVIEEPRKTAQLVMAALTRFITPHFILNDNSPLEILEKQAVDVVQLLVQGLKSS